MIIKFDITPIPKQSVRQGYSNGRSIFYQDSKYLKYSREIIAQAKAQLPLEFIPYDGPLNVEVFYIFECLKSAKKDHREFIESGGYILRTTKPDITDNLNKALFDALEGLLYVNDSRICVFKAVKVFGKTPGIILKIKKIDEKDTQISI